MITISLIERKSRQMLVDLEPCPFCGEKKNLEMETDYIGHYQISCRECRCFGPSTETIEDAIKARNPPRSSVV